MLHWSLWEISMPKDDKNIVIFDGVCNFCNSSVNFIIRHDPNAKFVFATLQSKLVQQLFEQYQIDSNKTDSIVLIKNNKTFIKSGAALEIAKELSGIWPIFYVFKIIPSPLRNYLYDLFAARRYKLFGKKDACMIPTAELREWFLDE